MMFEFDCIVIWITGKGIDIYQFKPVISALLFSLEQMLGDQFTAEIQSAWCHIYSHVMQQMSPTIDKHCPSAGVQINVKRKRASSRPEIIQLEDRILHLQTSNKPQVSRDTDIQCSK
jgi:hypothetical protein